MDKQITAEDVLKQFEELSNEKRLKFLDEMFYRHFNNKGLPRTPINWED